MFSRRQLVGLSCWALFAAGWSVLAVISFANDDWLAGTVKFVIAMLAVAGIAVATLKAARA